MSPAVKTLVDFVQGELDVKSFESSLYREAELEHLLSQQSVPKYARTGRSLYHYLIALNYRDPGDILDAQGALADLLRVLDIPVVPSKSTAELHGLLLAAQPKWLDADTSYLQSLLDGAPSFGTRAELKRWLRQRLLDLFRYVDKPPRWLQSPAWPIGKDGPLVFLGQIPVAGYFHDASVVYVFHDPGTNECESVVQTC